MMRDAIGAVLAVVIIAMIATVIGLASSPNPEAQHQDIACSTETGEILFFASDVTVRDLGSRIEVEWPGGRIRWLEEGTCEYAPHSPELEYDPQDVRSWRGVPEDRSVRWA